MTIKHITPRKYTPEEKRANCAACSLALRMRDCPACGFYTPPVQVQDTPLSLKDGKFYLNIDRDGSAWVLTHNIWDLETQRAHGHAQVITAGTYDHCKMVALRLQNYHPIIARCTVD